MGMFADSAREGMGSELCAKIAEKIEKYPEAIKALKELGNEILDAMDLPNIPEWTYEYRKLFRK